MSELNVETLKAAYLRGADCDIVDEAIESIEQYCDYMTEREIYGHQRPLMVAYLAILELKSKLNNTSSDTDISDIEEICEASPDTAYWIHSAGKSNIWYCSDCGEKITYNPKPRTYNVAKAPVHEINKFCRSCGKHMVGCLSVDMSSDIPIPTKNIGKGNANEID